MSQCLPVGFKRVSVKSKFSPWPERPQDACLRLLADPIFVYSLPGFLSSSLSGLLAFKSKSKLKPLACVTASFPPYSSECCFLGPTHPRVPMPASEKAFAGPPFDAASPTPCHIAPPPASFSTEHV